MAECLKFEVDDSVITNYILDHGGTLVKAISEGVMNSIDAGATSVDVEVSINDSRVVISDNGCGFDNAEEIKKVFGIFGYPHKEGDARFGRFRLGRGQLFKFGKNIWTSRGKRMVVDIDNMGLKYELDDAEYIDGCTIEISIYERYITQLNVGAIIGYLRQQLQYADIDIYVNGEKISNSYRNADHTWDYEDDNFCLKFRNYGFLNIFNDGIFVKTYSGAMFGVTGDLCTKKQLKLISARNEINVDCPVWPEIEKALKTLRKDSLLAKQNLTDSERQALCRALLNGEFTVGDRLDGRALDAKLLTTVDSKRVPLRKLSRCYLYDHKVCFAKEGSKGGDLLLKRKRALVLSDTTLEDFSVSTIAPKDFISKLFNVGVPGVEHIDIVELDDFADEISGDYVTITVDALPPIERLAFKSLQSAFSSLLALLNHNDVWNGLDIFMPYRNQWRQLVPGQSHIAYAWTDGINKIWISKNALSFVRKGLPGFIEIINILVHEMCHSSCDNISHGHDFNFMSSYHDITMDGRLIVGQIVSKFYRNFMKNAAKSGVNLTRVFKEEIAYLKALDSIDDAIGDLIPLDED